MNYSNYIYSKNLPTSVLREEQEQQQEKKEEKKNEPDMFDKITDILGVVFPEVDIIKTIKDAILGRSISDDIKNTLLNVLSAVPLVGPEAEAPLKALRIGEEFNKATRAALNEHRVLNEARELGDLNRLHQQLDRFLRALEEAQQRAAQSREALKLIHNETANKVSEELEHHLDILDNLLDRDRRIREGISHEDLENRLNQSEDRLRTITDKTPSTFLLKLYRAGTTPGRILALFEHLRNEPEAIEQALNLERRIRVSETAPGEFRADVRERTRNPFRERREPIVEEPDDEGPVLIRASPLNILDLGITEQAKVAARGLKSLFSGNEKPFQEPREIEFESVKGPRREPSVLTDISSVRDIDAPRRRTRDGLEVMNNSRDFLRYLDLLEDLRHDLQLRRGNLRDTLLYDIQQGPASVSQSLIGIDSSRTVDLTRPEVNLTTRTEPIRTEYTLIDLPEERLRRLTPELIQLNILRQEQPIRQEEEQRRRAGLVLRPEDYILNLEPPRPEPEQAPSDRTSISSKSSTSSRVSNPFKAPSIKAPSIKAPSIKAPSIDSFNSDIFNGPLFLLLDNTASDARSLKSISSIQSEQQPTPEEQIVLLRAKQSIRLEHPEDKFIDKALEGKTSKDFKKRQDINSIYWRYINSEEGRELPFISEKDFRDRLYWMAESNGIHIIPYERFWH